ncbi:hypothetical protein BCR42DRAFT_441279 [Absidia repens]|uniref:Uncharacterized protein n=1 Tax=Absidia repens TaxID=90262 RepID=A0A1X2I638_9FUNG|nr:hypothetical protein BCR42DRAFT_441279 [Absidia repens]
MLSLDYPTISSKHDTEYYIPEQTEHGHYYDNNNSTQQQLSYWPTTNEFNGAIPLWTSGYDQGLFPLLSHQHPSSTFEDPSIGTASDSSSSVARSPCYITSSPSTTFSSITSPTDQNCSVLPMDSNPAEPNPLSTAATASPTTITTTTTPLTH